MRNLKKVLALVLVFAMMLSTCVVASAASFPDVEANYQYSEAIDLLASLNILGGYEDGTFKPENNITRAEFAKVVYVIFNGMDDVNAQMYVSDSQFNDVAKTQWFNGHVNWASENSIVGGYGDGTFLPSNNVAVKEAIKMVVTAVTDKSLTYPNGYIQEARALKLLEDVTISSIDAPATRGQVAQLAYNLLFTASRLCLVDTGTMDFYGNEIYEKKAPIDFIFGLEPTEGVTLLATYENSFTDITVNTLEEGQVLLSTSQVPYDYAGDANDLFGQTLKAYTNDKGELIALVSVSAVVEETTVDKLVGRGTKEAPYGKITGEYITYKNDSNVLTKGYGVKTVYEQQADGQYMSSYTDKAITAENGEKYILLDAFYAEKCNNKGGKVTLIDNPVKADNGEYVLDNIVDTVIIEKQDVVEVRNYSATSKRITLGTTGVAFDKAVGHEAFANADFSTDADPVYATYTLTVGSAGKVYTLTPATTVEGVLSSTDKLNNQVVVGGTKYAAYGKDAEANVFEFDKLLLGDTLKLFLDANGFVVYYVVTDGDSVYDLNLGKVIAVSETADSFGHNVKATITVVTPDGTEKVLTIDTTKNAKVSDDVDCTWVEPANTKWVDIGGTVEKADGSDEVPAGTKSEVYFDYTYNVKNNENNSDYTIVGSYIHYEVDDDTNEVVRVVALEKLADNKPSNSKFDWTVDTVTDGKFNGKYFCYNTVDGFYTSNDEDGEKVAFNYNDVADNFVGMYYEENEDGQLETAYYTASNIPAFAGKGNFVFVSADNEIVAMVVMAKPEATADNTVLGIVTGFETVEGETQKNGKPSHRIAITMLVDGETKTFYTEDYANDNLPVVDFDKDMLTGLTTDQLAFLQLQTDGKVEVSDAGVIDIDYVVYEDLTFGVATNVRANTVTYNTVKTWVNPVASGWSVDENDVPTYSEKGVEGEITFDVEGSVLRICEETTFVTISGLPVEKEDDAGLFQATAASKLTAGGEILKSDAKKNIWYVFAFDGVLGDDAVDSDNADAVKTVYIFADALDAKVK